MEKVVCGCTPSFSSYVNNTTSVLNVGNLVGGSCTFTSYVIDWFRNGNKELVSGTNGAAPDIQAIHPFTGAAAIPVQGGTWVPVIRWVVVGGIKYYPQPTKCKKWCSSLTGLPTITVNSLNCGSTGGTPASGYQYKLTYNTTLDYTLASRTIRWDLPSDLSVINFAIMFTGFTVADKVEVFFKDSSTPLMAWIIGDNLNTNTYTAMPYKRDWVSTFKFVVGLPVYAAGDYLIVKVTPSVLETNILTNWDLNIKCLTASSVFNCNFLTSDMHTYNLPLTRLDWDAANCRYKLVLKANATFSNWISSSDVNYPFYFYAGFAYHLSTGAYWDRANNEMGSYLNFNKAVTLTWWYIPTYATASTLAGSVNLTKVGNVFTLTCTSQTDYDWYKANYNIQIAKVFYTDWSSDPTNIKHYRYWRFYWQSLPNGCGDTIIPAKDLWFSKLSIFDWNDAAKTCTITAVNYASNGMAIETCNNQKTEVDYMIQTLGYTITGANFSQNTICSYPLFGHGVGYTGITINKVLDYNTQSGIFAYSPYTSPCGPAMNHFYMHPTIPANFEWFTHFCKTKITSTVDGNGDFTESPSDNFEVYDYLHPTTRHLVQPFTAVLIYKKENGVQIVPAP